MSGEDRSSASGGAAPEAGDGWGAEYSEGGKQDLDLDPGSSGPSGYEKVWERIAGVVESLADEDRRSAVRELAGAARCWSRCDTVERIAIAVCGVAVAFPVIRGLIPRPPSGRSRNGEKSASARTDRGAESPGGESDPGRSGVSREYERLV